MINLERLLSNSPIPVVDGIFFHQPTMGQIIDMGEGMFWSMLKLWNLSRTDMVESETEESKKLSDYEIWLYTVLATPALKYKLIQSIDCFLHEKVEFLEVSHTIIVGEKGKSVLLDEVFYNHMQTIATSLFDMGTEKSESDQYQVTEGMSEREKEMIRKMQKRAETLDRIRDGEKDSKNRLIKQLVSLVAIGHYTFNQVYEMTMIQMIYLLRKYVEIQSYELHTMLSPYMDSKRLSQWNIGSAHKLRR